MIEVNKEYRNMDCHRVLIVLEKDDRFVGVNFFNGDLSWYRGNGTCTAGVKLNLLMPVELQVGKTYLSREGVEVLIVYIAEKSKADDLPVLGVSKRAGKTDDAHWYTLDGCYYHTKETSANDLILEKH